MAIEVRPTTKQLFCASLIYRNRDPAALRQPPLAVVALAVPAELN